MKRKLIAPSETVLALIARHVAPAFILHEPACKPGEYVPVIGSLQSLASTKCQEISKGESEASVANWNLRPFVLVKWWNDYNWKK